MNTSPPLWTAKHIFALNSYLSWIMKSRSPKCCQIQVRRAMTDASQHKAWTCKSPSKGYMEQNFRLDMCTGRMLVDGICNKKENLWLSCHLIPINKHEGNTKCAHLFLPKLQLSMIITVSMLLQDPIAFNKVIKQTASMVIKYQANYHYKQYCVIKL